MSTRAASSNPIEDAYPLSPIQEGMLFHCLLDPSSAFYVTQLSCRLEPLDAALFEQAWAALFERHTALRTAFAWKKSDRPLQVVGRRVTLPWWREDWRELGPPEQEKKLAAYLHEDAARPFALNRAPLARFALFQLDAARYAFVWTHHHLLIDGWSLPVILAELAELYAALVEGRDAILPPPRPFRELIAWLQAQLQAQGPLHAEAFWRTELTGFAEPTPLVVDRPAEAGAPTHNSDLTVALEAPAARALEELARRHQLTLSTVTAAAWAALLERYGGRADVLFGVTVSGRPPELPEVERMVGNFINTLPLRTRVPAARPFLAWALEVQQQTAEMREHSHSPLVEVQGWSEVPRGLPLFESIFFFQNFPLGDRDGRERLGTGRGQLAVSALRIHEATNYPLIVVVAPRAELILRFEYLPARFERATIARLARHLLNLLAGVIARPEAAVQDLPLLSPAERHQLRCEWNDSAAAFPPAASLLELLLGSAARRPDATALVAAGGRRNYRELAARAGALGARLAGLGVGPESLVALWLERGLELVELVLGSFAAGAAYLPLDPQHPPARHRQILERAGARCVVVADAWRDDLEAALEPLPEALRPRVVSVSELDATPAGLLPRALDASQLAYVIFTSGSTGVPKGAMVDQRGMVNHLWAKVRGLGLGSGDRVAQNASPCFDISVWQMLAALAVGGEVHVVEDEVAQDPLRLLERVESAGITVLELVPSLLRAMVEALEAGGRRPPLAALRWLIPTGEALPPDLVARFDALYPRVRWVNAYGPTECSDDVTHAYVEPAGERPRVTIGRPVANMRLRVRDRRGRLLPLGVPGELWVSGTGVGRGYRAEPRRTAEVFWPDEEGSDENGSDGKSGGRRAYRTGDLARLLADGEIDFLGRIDHQVKIRGHRIELGEIEARLREHPAIADCVVVAHDDAAVGAQLVAYVVERSGAEAAAGLEAEQVAGWRSIFEEAYAQGSTSSRDAGINLRVWVSSYTGRALPEPEIFECFEDSVARILALVPEDVLEIGCGTGLLLRRIAPHCRSYVGTDLSAQALAAVARQAADDGLPAPTLLERAAHDFEGLPRAAYDLVVINEVVQYFPSVEYLAAVLQGALAHVKPGGHLFVGGVRSLPHFEAFHTSVQLHRADDAMSCGELAAQVRQQERQEKELLVDPRLFGELARRHPEVRGVWVELKGGRHDNELTKFRYDVFLQVGGPELTEPLPLPQLEWRAGQTTLAEVEQRLRREPAGLRLTEVPNARLLADLAAVAALARGPVDRPVGALRRDAVVPESVAPAALWELGERLGRAAHVGWASSGDPGRIEAVFVPRRSGRPAAEARYTAPPGTPVYRSWALLGNRPLAPAGPEPIAPLLKAFLGERLPDWMVPAAWVSLPLLPLTANGKIDRKALPDPTPEARLQGRYQAPRGPVEELLADIFASVLGVPRVGAEDDFFALGGHSLKATQVASRLRQVLAIELPLRSLFDAPTVAALAREIARLETDGGAADEAPLVPRDRGMPPSSAPLSLAPLSFAQERLWFVDQLQPGTAVYNMPLFYRAHGRLAAHALAAALGQIVRRHEVLRTVYPVASGRPVQQVEAASRFALRHLDLSALAAAEREHQSERLANELVRRPFDLTVDIPLRAVLLRLGREDHLLAMVTHHIAFDGSFQVFARELVTVYQSELEGRPASLPEPVLQYGDFALWQRRWLSGEVERRLLAYWTGQLAGQPPALELPLDRPRPPVITSAGATQLFRLPPALAAQARALARREGVTLFMITLAVFEALLYRLTGQRDLSLGSPVLDRPRAELEPLIGNFVNTVVLRTRLAPEGSFTELLRAVRETALGAYAHQQLPFEALVEALQPERSLRHTALFQVMFVLLNESALAADLELPGLLLAQPKSERRTARFDLLLAVWEGEDELSGTVEYRTDLFDRTTILRLLERYQRLFGAALADPRLALARLPLASAAEQQQLIAEWNDTAAPYERSANLYQLFATTAERQPEAVATIGGGETWTYGALAARVQALAVHLRARGAGPGRFVGVCLERGPRLVEALLATVASGAAYVPMEPAFPAARLEWILATLDVRLLLTETSTGSRLASLAAWGRLDEAVALDQPLPLAGGRLPAVTASSNDLAYVIFTSGSTGTPKGVMVRHEPVVNLIEWVNRRFAVGPGDRLLFTTSPCFDLSVYDVFGVLAAGGTVRVASGLELAEPERLVEVLASEGITFWDSAPAALQRLVPLFGVAGAPFTGSPLRRVFLSGDWVPLGLPPRLRAAFPHAEVVSLGGATEATVWSNVFPVAELAPHWISVPYGRPIQNARYHVLDGGLEPCPIGVPGDLYIGGECLAGGYLGAAALTAAKFLPDPFSLLPGERLYRTGDRARFFADGNLEFLGRLDHQVKIRGYRIELGEIEAVLGEHPEVAEAVVVAREDLPGGKALAAYVVPRQLPGPAPLELREHLRSRLPEYMVPAAVLLLAALPTTANGKLDRKALPALSEQAAGAEQVAPRTPHEQVIAALWTEVLGVERVGAFDDFFELGGHSLLATQLLARLREVFPAELSLRQLFEAPTVAGLAHLLAAAEPGAGDGEVVGLAPVARGAPLPLSFAQQRLWLLDRLEPGNPAYNLTFALELSGALDVAALARALTRVVARHEALRTTFREAAGGLWQRVEPPYEVALPVLELSALPEAARARRAEAWLQAEARRSFDLERGPLLAAGLLCLAPERHLLALTLHHIASDGWSMEVLVREVGALYREHLGGPSARLPELPVQYPDYAVWQRRTLAGARLEQLLERASALLSDLPAALELPLDRPRPRHSSSRGAGAAIEVTGSLASAVRQLARSQAATPFMVLLAAWATLLARLSRQHRFAIGTPVANRDRPELEGLIGLFVNTLVLPIELAGAPSFAEMVGRVREVALAAHAFHGLPFERLVEQLAPERDLGRSPLFQVMFSLENVRAEPIVAPGLAVAARPVPVVAAAFDLTLALAESSAGWHGLLEYSTELFDPATPERWGRHFSALLAAGLAEPARGVLDLSWLTCAERRAVLAAGGLGVASGEGEPRLDALVAAAAQARPEAVAVVGAGEHWSYDHLLARAAGVAGRLAGIGCEQAVGVVAERTPEMVAGCLGVLAAGATLLPLDPGLPAERLAALLARAGAGCVLVTAGPLAELACEGCPACALADLGTAPWPWAPRSAGAGLAYLLFTSGSTGRPKGVMVEHRAIATFARVASELYGIGPGARVLQFASIGFDTSLEEIFTTLASGATLVLRDAELLGSPERFFAGVAEQAISVLDLPTAWWHTLVPYLERATVPACVERVILGGERAAGAAMARWHDAVGERLVTFNTYGPTETTIVVSAWRAPAQTGPPAQPGSPAQPGLAPDPPIGRALAGARVHALDTRLEPLPWGVPGELYLGGFGLARGYLAEPARTAERFVPDPFALAAGARLYRSGDLARLRPDGELEFLGRVDRQLKVRGFRVEPSEIEAELAAEPEIEQAVVLPWPSGTGGAVDRLVAYLVAVPDRTLPADAELRLRLRRRLPEPLIPAAFVTIPTVPLTRNGKVDIAALPAPSGGSTEATRPSASPLEELVTQLFVEVLGAPVPSAQASFFDLGGHSLLAAQLVARLRTVLGVDLPLIELFDTPTPAALAQRLAELATGAASDPGPIATGERPEFLPLSFAQEQLWFQGQLAPGSSEYHIPEAVRVDGELDLARLRHAFEALAARHETLRTVFREHQGQAFQLVLPAAALVLPVIDLAGLAAGGRDRAARELMARAVARPFALAERPSWRAVVLRQGPAEHVVGLVLHHIIADGTSVQLLVRELLTAYQAGAPAPAPLPLQYADFALWQRRRLQGEELERLLAYWRRQLAGGPVELALPADQAGLEDEPARGGIEPFLVERRVEEALAALAREQSATLYMVLLAAFQLLLARYAGVEEVPVGTYFGGRDRAELAGLVGIFVNTLVVQTDLSGEPSFRQLLARVRETTLGAFLHRELPFVKLVEDQRRQGGGNRALFQAAFNFDQTSALAQPAPEIAGLAFSSFPISNPSAPVELTLELEGLPEGLRGVLRYDTRRYSEPAARRILEHYQHLLAAIAQDPDGAVFALPLDSEAPWSAEHSLTAALRDA